MDDYNNLGRIYECKVNSYSEEDTETLTSANGNHLGGESNSDVKGIHFDLRDKNLDYIPNGLNKTFSNIIAIYVKGGKISRLNGEELSAYKNLQYFGMRDNPLEYVPGNLFRNNPKIKTIDFYNNGIKYVSYGVLDRLYYLRYVDFSLNACINQRASSASAVGSLKNNLREKCAVGIEGQVLYELSKHHRETTLDLKKCLLDKEFISGTTDSWDKVLQNVREINFKIEKRAEENQAIKLQLESLSQANKEINLKSLQYGQEIVSKVNELAKEIQSIKIQMEKLSQVNAGNQEISDNFEILTVTGKKSLKNKNKIHLELEAFLQDEVNTKIEKLSQGNKEMSSQLQKVNTKMENLSKENQVIERKLENLAQENEGKKNMLKDVLKVITP